MTRYDLIVFIDLLTANEALDTLVTSGGSWWVSLSNTVPDSGVSVGTVSEPAGQTRAELPRTAAAWDTAAGRAVQPADVLQLPAPTADLGTIVAWVGWDAPAGGTPRIAGRLGAGLTVVAGSGLFLPAESLRITSP